MGNPKAQIQDSIVELTYQINQLRKKLGDCKATNRLYNKMIVKRAVLKSELATQKSSNIVSFFKKLKRGRKEKLISDYFK